MKIDEILDVIAGLAKSQGFYGRLLENLLGIRDNSPEEWANVVEDLEALNFKEPLDVVLYFEQ